MYLMFPIGWMYYFGTNLEDRFTVPGFWPTQDQSHKLPYDKDELKVEVERIRGEIKEREIARRKRETESRLEEARRAFREGNAVQDQEAMNTR